MIKYHFYTIKVCDMNALQSLKRKLLARADFPVVVQSYIWLDVRSISLIIFWITFKI